MLRAVLVLVTFWLLIDVGYAQAPKRMPPAEGMPLPNWAAPAPRVLPGNIEILPGVEPDYIIGGPLPRVGTREVWQYYGLNGFSRFVPRVIATPAGAYYYRTGEPYPWMQSHPELVRPR